MCVCVRVRACVSVCSLAAMQASYCEQKADEVAKYHKSLTDQVRVKVYQLEPDVCVS